ncbi:NADH-quinone oxidoreductase subunit D [Ornithinimicrobium humiphilum]|uniref:NADH-quinone oxidoreductase subunit D n=1 Tax=Ornithinimicrobium humiphilum TaxID=125288 RepID=A0A543KRJ5_9MICO|nr:NADH-quinone oxidoreductase subunit D [Ornithinimicrobium humiphilum]TQM97696.1 NADH dehydrogenase subunit D [Ornithinimicrobium humiphilum]
MSTHDTTRTGESAETSQDYYGTPGGPEDETPTYTVGGGGDWDEMANEVAALGAERIVVNMGPQHPSTHGVLRLVLELDGETVREARAGIGFLHTGIEKNMEYRTWVQGTTFCTRMDYLTPIFNEAAYCLAVEKLLGITDQIPQRASDIRVLMMELNRIGSHLICLATGGMELGATTIMTIGFRERERILRFFEAVTGLRMNHAYVRPGGVAQDVLPEHLDLLEKELPDLRRGIREMELLLLENPVFKGRTVDVGHLSLSGCMALGVTGPILRSTGLPHDLRKSDPYCGYETYEFDVITRRDADAYGRVVIRFDEMWQSLRIAEQAIERLRASQGQPVMVEDRKIAWPAQLSVGADGQGNSLDHIREIMGESMEGLIHHFKLVTEGFRVPPGQAYHAIESPKGELGVHVVSDGGTRPWRAHFRDPSFHNLQAASALAEGGLVADVIVAVASIDPVMGGVDR